MFSKAIFYRQVFLYLCLMFVLPSYSLDELPRSIVIENDITAVDKLYSLDKESLSYDKVLFLSNRILSSGHLYSNDILAKTYVLLADVATNRGELVQASQFAKDGLTLLAIDQSIKINLHLKLIAGYYADGNYSQVISVSSETILLAENSQNIQYKLFALSYRAMAYFLLNQDNQAVNDLKTVEFLFEQHKGLANQIELLEIIAIAHFHLGDFQEAISMHEKILKLRFDLSKTKSIEQTYTNLARAYYKVNRLDDAYNAFWHAKKHAEIKGASVKLAYANLGLGKVLFRQGNDESAYEALLKAEKVFKKQNLHKPYFSVVIALTKVLLSTNRTKLAYHLLSETKLLIGKAGLANEHAELYLQLSNMYDAMSNRESAYEFLNYYANLSHKAIEQSSLQSWLSARVIKSSTESKKIAKNLAEESQLKSFYREKYQKQNYMILSLTCCSIFLLVALFYLWIKKRNNQQHKEYDAVEQPTYILPAPAETRKFYQQSYKMARKFEYPLAVGYLSVENWQELSFQYNKKTVSEVSKTLATLINQHMGEFDNAGLINRGEYLILCPHQTSEGLEDKLEKISEALKVRFFANLGDFSIKINFASNSPAIQDIDPYIFLSRLTEASSKNINSR